MHHIIGDPTVSLRPRTTLSMFRHRWDSFRLPSQPHRVYPRQDWSMCNRVHLYPGCTQQWYQAGAGQRMKTGIGLAAQNWHATVVSQASVSLIPSQLQCFSSSWPQYWVCGWPSTTGPPGNGSSCLILASTCLGWVRDWKQLRSWQSFSSLDISWGFSTGPWQKTQSKVCGTCGRDTKRGGWSGSGL